MRRSLMLCVVAGAAGGLALAIWLRAADPAAPGTNQPPAANLDRPAPMDKPIPKTDAEWKKLLTDEQYHVLRRKGTERPFTGAFWDHHEAGVYLCAGCGQELFSSTNKFDSGCGWPSYTQPVDAQRVTQTPDHSLMMHRTEITCSRCGGHLGHVFDDGPAPTGQRYCINSASLKFEKKDAPTPPPPKPQAR